MALDVIAAGELYIDLILTGLDRWPKPGEEALAENFRREAGGGAAIASCGLARLGIGAAVAGAIGEDGAWLTERLVGRGVATEMIRRVPGESTGITLSASDSRDRAFFTYKGANRRFGEIARGTDFAARHLHWAAPADSELFARLHGITLSMDVGFAHADDQAKAALPLVDLFFPNLLEAETMTGERDPEAMLRAFAKLGARGVVLKMGSGGAAMLDRGRFLCVPAERVEPADTTGAGDAFNAGFLYGWLNGKSAERCLRLGNFCGTMSTRALGGIAAFPRLEEIAWLEK